MRFDRVLTTFADFFARERLRYTLVGVDRAAVRKYFARHGLSELFDAITKKS